MADWRNINNTSVTFDAVASLAVNGKTKVYIQYDYDSKTATSVKIRFVYDRTSAGGSAQWTDAMYILYDANNSGDTRQLLKLKSYAADADDYPFYSSSITVKKGYTTADFPIQDYWICNNGQNAIGSITTSTAYSNFKSGGARQNYCVRVGSQRFALKNTVATNVTANKPTITDNGNNTFTITGTAGNRGENGNAVKSTALYYYRNTESIHTKASSLTVSNQGLTIAASGPYQTIYAYTKVDGTYNDAESSKVSSNIKNYQAPSNPGTPTLTSDSFKNGRLTVKQSWTYTAEASTATNTSSSVVGYRIRIFKNGTALTGLGTGTTNNTIVKGNNTNSFVDRSSTATTVTFDPVALGFVAGDKVKISLQAWSKNGKGSWLMSSQTASAETTVQNAGVARVRVNGAWKEGIVNVRVGGAWKEADIVKARVSGAWKESS